MGSSPGLYVQTAMEAGVGARVGCEKSGQRKTSASNVPAGSSTGETGRNPRRRQTYLEKNELVIEQPS